MAIDGTMATRAVTPAGLAAPSAGRARSSRARNLAIPNATSATATRREVSQQVTYRVDIPIMALSRLDAREASMRYRDDLMAGREESMEESTAVKVIASAEEESESKKEETPEVESEPKVDRWASLMDPRGQADPISAANIGLDPRAGGAPVDGAEGGAGAPRLQGHGVEAVRAVRGNRSQPGGPLRREVYKGRHLLAVLGEEEDDVRQLRGPHG